MVTTNLFIFYVVTNRFYFIGFSLIIPKFKIFLLFWKKDIYKCPKVKIESTLWVLKSEKDIKDLTNFVSGGSKSRKSRKGKRLEKIENNTMPDSIKLLMVYFLTFFSKFNQ